MSLGVGSHTLAYDSPAVSLSHFSFRLAHVSEIMDLRWTILRQGLPREAAQFDHDDDATTQHFAAFDDRTAVACATFLRGTYDNEPAWQLRGMAVSEAHQGEGLGTKLLAFAESIIRPQEYSNLLWCNARLPAVRFYERLGWI